MATYFIRLLEKQMHKGKDYVFDFNDPAAVEKFRYTLRIRRIEVYSSRIAPAILPHLSSHGDPPI